MPLFLLRSVRFFVDALVDDATPKQLAIGAALGLAVGLVPKENLLAVALMTLLCALRINLGMATATAFVASWLGYALDPLTHRLGAWLLTNESLRPLWLWLGEQPLAPWTKFNNTVVLGSFVVGVVLAWPTYRIARPLCERYAPTIAARLQRMRIVRVLQGLDVARRLENA